MKPEKPDAMTVVIRISASLVLFAPLSWILSSAMPSLTGRHPGILTMWVILISVYAAVRFAVEDRIR